jgi:hypothetical protein
MRADIKKAKKLFHNFANAPRAAITTLQNVNSFVFIKKCNCEEGGQKVSQKYLANEGFLLWYLYGIFFFVGGLFAISQFEQIYSGKFDKYFMVIFVIKEII